MRTDFFAEFRREHPAVGKDDLSTAPPTTTKQPSKSADRAPVQTGRGFLVAIDGAAVCRSCGSKGHIPHHLSLIFWKFWTRAQISALLAVMADDERLAWLAKGLVRLESPDGRTRELRETEGFWVETDEPSAIE